MSENYRITGTLVYYYSICPRQVWYMAHYILPDEDMDNIVIGRWVHEKSYPAERHEILLDNIKIDVVKGRKQQVLVGEIKKSRRAEDAARLQLKYYLYELKKEYGLELNGVLLFPEEKRREEITLDEEGTKEIEEAIKKIEKILDLPLPPPPKKNKYCKPCAYSEFCWA